MRTTVTKEYIDKRIGDVAYHVLPGTTIPGTTITICLIKMVNGYKVVGKSACVNPDNFDAAVWRKHSYDDAFEQLWALEGYLLAEELHRAVQSPKVLHNKGESRGQEETP